jgi:hypothetical protein
MYLIVVAMLAAKIRVRITRTILSLTLITVCRKVHIYNQLRVDRSLLYHRLVINLYSLAEIPR